jgi:hypothetical protein
MLIVLIEKNAHVDLIARRIFVGKGFCVQNHDLFFLWLMLGENVCRSTFWYEESVALGSFPYPLPFRHTA